LQAWRQQSERRSGSGNGSGNGIGVGTGTGTGTGAGAGAGAGAGVGEHRQSGGNGIAEQNSKHERGRSNGLVRRRGRTIECSIGRTSQVPTQRCVTHSSTLAGLSISRSDLDVRVHWTHYVQSMEVTADSCFPRPIWQTLRFLPTGLGLRRPVSTTSRHAALRRQRSREQHDLAAVALSHGPTAMARGSIGARQR
jgi:hypothetical protein